MRFRYFLWLLVFVFVNAQVSGQKLHFPKEARTTDSLLEACIPQMARKVLAQTPSPTTGRAHSNLYQLLIVGKDYLKVQDHIDAFLDSSTVNRYAEYNVFIDEVYTKANLLQRAKGHSFEKAFEEAFEVVYSSMNPKLTAGIGFSIDGISKDSFLKLLEKYTETDSLSLPEATSLCVAYRQYFYVTSGIKALAERLLDKKHQDLFIIEKDVVIKLPDGGTANALVIRKKGTKKLPAIFYYNIYASKLDLTMAKRAALNGYVGVSVNTRGKRLSQDAIEPFENDGKDSYAIIDWISKQKWCNGTLGMMGGSYLGFSQWSTQKKPHPALKTIVPQVSVGIGTMDYPMNNHVFMSYMLRWIQFSTNNKFIDLETFMNTPKWDSLYNEWYMSGKAFKELDMIEGKRNEIFQRWLQHPSHDEFWQEMVPYEEEFKNINIPILTTTGYYDADQAGAIYYNQSHHQYNPKAEHYMVIGPYSHGGGQHFAYKMAGKHRIDDVANISMHQLAFEWFDYVLKGNQKPALLKGRINYQVMGTNTWKSSNGWNSINSDSITMYLTSTRKGDYYKLKFEKPAQERFITQEVDFKERSEGDIKTAHSGPWPMLPKELNHPNSLSFLSDTVAESFSINGSFVGELNASINKKDMDVVIEFYEVLPDGTHFQLTNYLGRASYAKDRTKRELLEPNQKTSIPISNSYFVSKQIGVGSRLLIVLQINKNPRWQINYGSGKDVSEETIEDAKEPLLIDWYNDSHIKMGINK